MPLDHPSSPGRIAWRQWGTDLEAESIKQMHNACALPVAAAAALMPDAHVGYGLPIGGILATRGAVIPYAVGVDIACRVRMSVLELPVQDLQTEHGRKRLTKALEEETNFGVGGEFRKRREHDVMDRDWTVSPVTKRLKDKAAAQLGTSGSGNHFVEFGIFTLQAEAEGLARGTYLALLSHSGSRGTGAGVCDHYSKLAMNSRRELPKELSRLAWLDLDSQEGREYWDAMNLMGHYASANHALIHKHVAKNLGAKVLHSFENHHNFAWKEIHDGREVMVHRKGATPAGEGVLGVIPGSMADAAFVVRGKGNADSLMSASHGAGRRMSRTEARKQFSWRQWKPILEKRGVRLLGGGLDEVPGAYKDIRSVMAAQSDLVDVVATFEPKVVLMCNDGSRAED